MTDTQADASSPSDGPIILEHPCPLRCITNHACVMFADYTFQCLDNSFPTGLPPAAECTPPPVTIQPMPLPDPDSSVILCGKQLICSDGFCQYPCPGCPKGSEPETRIFPKTDPALNSTLSETFCCKDAVWGRCKNGTDCGGDPWACDNGVCTPPWLQNLVPGQPTVLDPPSPTVLSSGCSRSIDNAISGSTLGTFALFATTSFFLAAATLYHRKVSNH